MPAVGATEESLVITQQTGGGGAPADKQQPRSNKGGGGGGGVVDGRPASTCPKQVVVHPALRAQNLEVCSNGLMHFVGKMIRI